MRKFKKISALFLSIIMVVMMFPVQSFAESIPESAAVAASLPGITISGTIHSYGDNAGEVTVRLYQKGSNSVAYEQIITGNNADYSIAGVAAGEYDVVVTKQYNVQKKYDLIVGTSNIFANDYSIYFRGDVNEDGSIDNMDIKRLQSHINGVFPLADEAIGDINQDGIVNNTDLKRLQLHVNGVLPLYGVTMSGTIYSSGIHTDKVTISLYKGGSLAYKQTIANNTTYKICGVFPGVYDVEISQQYSVPTWYNVKVGDNGLIVSFTMGDPHPIYG